MSPTSPTSPVCHSSTTGHLATWRTETASARFVRARGSLALSPQLRARVRGEPACRPGSVPPLSRGGGHPSGTAVAGSLVRSTREHRAGRPRSLAQGAVAPLLTLLRVGFTEPPQSPAALVVSYTTVSPLPLRWRAGAVCFLWHCPAGHPGSALPTTLPCGARTFLTGLAPGATARPTHPCSGYAERNRAGVAHRSTPANDASDSIAAAPPGGKRGANTITKVRCP